ncbi:aminopeptidase N-like isoform X2 [Cataglyphis hispanica]|uniref:aminopeptidase N-like isoform X2 n=1 Tax=Cataglyphis hispanica TaxID=1086592 RepID=UPI00218062C6|nr:aminopeptidase N-like isoform X2 [Cataglyphis hispanica]
MAHLTLLLNGIIIFLIVMVYSSDEDALKSLTNTVPKHYNIKLILQIEENTFIGQCQIKIKILKTTHEISMFSEKMSIMQSELVTPFFDETMDTFKIYNELRHSYDYDKNMFTLYFKEELSPGFYTLHINYSSIFNDGGFQRIFYFSEVGKIWLSATFFQPIWARRIFPCWGSSKTTFDIIIHHPQEYSVLSNMPVRAISFPQVRFNHSAEDNLQWSYITSTPAMSPFRLSIIVSNFIRNYIYGDDIPSMMAYGNLWCEERSISSLQFAQAIIKNVTLYLEKEADIWKYLHKFPKVSYVIIPNFQPLNNSMANLGIVIYNEADVVYIEGKDSIGCKYNAIRVIGYEIIREWFDNTINPFWKPKSWLSKGFTTFFTTFILNQSLPNSRIMDLFVVHFHQESLHFDVDDRMLSHTYREIKTIPVKIANYVKAPVIFRMLQYVFDIDIFWRGIHTYLYKKEHNPDNFWETLKNIYDKINKGSSDIKEMMYPWSKQKGYPVLNILKHDSNSVNISIENLDKTNEDRWIPVSYTTETDANFNDPAPLLWLQPPKKPFNHPYIHYFILTLKYREDGWVIFNIQQTGYYRVNYDDAYWLKIAVYLNSENYRKIHVLNRAQIIDDAFHFLLLNKLKPDTFWELTKYLSQETDYIAWYPMFKVIQYISNSFSFLEIGEYYIKEQLKKMLDGLLQIIKYEEKSTDDDFTKALRQEAMQWACFLKLFNCLTMANNQLKQHLEFSTKLSPWWKKWTYCYGLETADNTTWHQMLNKITGVNEQILYFLTCSNHLVEINNYVLTSYTKDDAVELDYKAPQYNTYDNKSSVSLVSYNRIITQYALRHFVFTIANNTRNSKTFKNLLVDFENITPSQVTMPVAFLILINNIYSNQQLDAVFSFFQSVEKYQIYNIHDKIRTRKSQLNNRILLLNSIKPINRSHLEV